jgi:uncharacterized protein DUF4926
LADCDGRISANVDNRLSPATMTAELDLIILTKAFPGHHLQKGDIGTIVHVLEEGKAYEAEFVTLQGVTIALLTLTPSQFRGIEVGDTLHARHELALAA